MDEQRSFGHVAHELDLYLDLCVDEELALRGKGGTDPATIADRPPRPTLSAWTFYAACGVTGFFAALIVAFVFHEVIGEPIGLLLAVAAMAWVVTSLLLYHVAKRRACDRAIVMGGGLVSAVMCSMMFLD